MLATRGLTLSGLIQFLSPLPCREEDSGNLGFMSIGILVGAVHCDCQNEQPSVKNQADSPRMHRQHDIHFQMEIS